MREAWTGDIVAQLHIYGFTQSDLANKMRTNRSYINQVLNGVKKPANAEARCRAAMSELIKERGIEESAKNTA